MVSSQQRTAAVSISSKPPKPSSAKATCNSQRLPKTTCVMTITSKGDVQRPKPNSEADVCDDGDDDHFQRRRNSQSPAVTTVHKKNYSIGDVTPRAQQ